MNNIHSSDKNKGPQSVPAPGKDSTDQRKDARAANSGDTRTTTVKDAGKGSQSPSKS